VAKGDYDRAIADLDEAIRLDADKLAYYVRGQAYYLKHDYDRAIADFDEAIQRDPKDARAYNNRGFAYEGKGAYARAIVDYDAALKLDPALADARQNRDHARASLAELRTAQGQEKTAPVQKTRGHSRWHLHSWRCGI
jgi:tetratricopeptide (TPR) repeat protein